MQAGVYCPVTWVQRISCKCVKLCKERHPIHVCMQMSRFYANVFEYVFKHVFK